MFGQRLNILSSDCFIRILNLRILFLYVFLIVFLFFLSLGSLKKGLCEGGMADQKFLECHRVVVDNQLLGKKDVYLIIGDDWFLN